MLRLLTAFTLLFANLGNTAPPLLDKGKAVLAPPPAPLVELISPKGNGSKGSLSIKLGEKRETITFGEKQPYYIVGVVLHSSALPSDLRAEFKGYHLIQLMMGTYSNAVGENVPQFGSIGIVTPKIPAMKKLFSANVMNRKKAGYAQISLKSPSTSATLSDEDRLKSNYFSQEGTLIYEPLGAAQEVKVSGTLGTLPMKRQRVVIEINSTLSTPFNPLDGDVKGRIETYVYWPSRKNSQQLVQNLASSALGTLFNPKATPSLPLPTENANRVISGSSKKDPE